MGRDNFDPTVEALRRIAAALERIADSREPVSEAQEQDADNHQEAKRTGCISMYRKWVSSDLKKVQDEILKLPNGVSQRTATIVFTRYWFKRGNDGTYAKGFARQMDAWMEAIKYVSEPTLGNGISVRRAQMLEDWARQAIEIQKSKQ